MNPKLKFLVALALLAIAFSGGLKLGSSTLRGDVDPQDYIKTVFTPYDSGIDNYLSFLDEARQSVHIADYSFTEPRIVDKLLELKSKRKVDIHLLLDKSQTEGRSGEYEQTQIERLQQAGIEVLVGTSEVKHQILHCKYTVVDGYFVETGSWNYTKSANDQDNTLDFIKSKKRGQLFLDNWWRMHKYIKSQQAPSAPSGQPRHSK